MGHLYADPGLGLPQHVKVANVYLAMPAVPTLEHDSNCQTAPATAKHTIIIHVCHEEDKLCPLNPEMVTRIVDSPCWPAWYKQHHVYIILCVRIPTELQGFPELNIKTALAGKSHHDLSRFVVNIDEFLHRIANYERLKKRILALDTDEDKGHADPAMLQGCYRINVLHCADGRPWFLEHQLGHATLTCLIARIQGDTTQVQQAYLRCLILAARDQQFDKHGR